MKLKKIKCAFCPNWFVPENQRQKYCSKECYNKAKRIRENKTYNAKQLARFNLPAGTRKMCQACPQSDNRIRDSMLPGSQECRNEIDERNRIQAQKKPCRQCGNDITRARNHKYCSDKCRYEAWRDGKRKHPKNSNCRRCKNVITDKKQLVYCTAECRLEPHQGRNTTRHMRKKSARNARPYWSTCVARIVLPNVVACSTLLDRKNVMPRRQRLSERQNADPNHLENYVKKVQREAEERRRALRGLS